MMMNKGDKKMYQKKVPLKIINNNAIIPTKGSEAAAGYDLYAAIDTKIMIKPHTTVKIDTGIAVALPDNTFGGIFARSGIATKRGLRPANGVGVIDADYRGNIIVALHNDTDIVQYVEPQERIAQLIIIPYVNVQFKETDELSETERGAGGFGSSGTK